MTTISDGTTTVTPLLVLGYEAEQESRNVRHIILGRADDDVSLAPDSLRTGTLKLLFADETAAEAARTLHSTPARFQLTDDDVSLVTMTYVRQGRMRIILDPDTLQRWTLEVGFQEVAP